MSRPAPILKAKIAPPRISSSVTRERLIPRMDAIPRKKLTVVAAGAGYGKTTFAVQAAQRLGLPVAWLSLDEGDRDVRGFFHYVAAAMASCIPSFGEKVSPILVHALHPKDEPGPFLTMFLNALEEVVTSPLLLVLDDFHTVQEDETIRRAVDVLIRHLPASLHLLLTGRTEPRLPLSRLRATRALQEIREADLAFSPEETDTLFRELFHVELGREQRDLLQARTGGWVSGLILFRHAVREGISRDLDRILAGLEGAHGVIAEYLKETVFRVLPEETRRFLLQTSILPRLDGSFCDRLLDRADSLDVLRGLERDHLFTASVDEGEGRFQIHRLFREFLRDRLALELPRTDVRALHQKAAALLEAGGDDEEALEQYLSAGAIQDACRMLDRIAIRLVLEGRLRRLQSCLEKIPQAALRKEPWFQFIRAGAMELSGDLKEAAALYEKAWKAYRRHESHEYRAICLQSLARTSFIRGDLETAEARFQELLGEETVTSFHPLGTLGYLVFIAAFQGRIEDADRFYRRGQAVIARGGGHAPEFEAWLDFGRSAAHLASGDLQQALDTAHQANETFSTYRRSRGNSVYHILTASACHRLGRFSEGLAYAEEGLRVVEEKPYPDSARGRLLLLAALNGAETGLRDEARSQAGQGLTCFQRNGNVRGLIVAHEVLHVLHRSSGDFDRAEAHLDEGLLLAAGVREPVLEGELKRLRAELRIEQGEPKQALPLLREAERALSHSAWDRFRIALLFARLFQNEGDETAALEHLAQGLDLAEAFRYDPWVARQRDWILPLLAAAHAKGLKANYIERCVHAMGRDARQELEGLCWRGGSDRRKSAARLLKNMPPPSRPALRVCMLGVFRATIEGEEIPLERWRGRQPLELFKYLLHAHPHAVKNHVLMELLWPGRDPAKGRKRLNVALVSLRKALEPDRARGTPSAYLLKWGDAYRIDLGENGWVDVNRFRDAAGRADAEADPERAAALFREAESLYGGDFLEEDIYCEWCALPRERLRREYLRVLSNLLDAHEREGDLKGCIACAEKALNADPCDETLYQRLMRYHRLAGNRALVIQTFERCRKEIEETLHCTLAEETQALFEELL